MGDAQKYTVVMSGEIGPGCDMDKAKAEFAELFKTTVEKSEPYFQGKRRVLRKDLGQKQAQAYEEALTKIGIISDLLPQQVEEAIPKTSIELSVVDMKPKKPVELAVVEHEAKKAPELSVVDMEPKNPAPGLKVEGLDRTQAANSMICPKCKTQQELASACEECGVIVEKYRQIASSAPAPIHPSALESDQGDQIASEKPDNTNTKIIAGVSAVLISITLVVVILI